MDISSMNELVAAVKPYMETNEKLPVEISEAARIYLQALLDNSDVFSGYDMAESQALISILMSATRAVAALGNPLDEILIQTDLAAKIAITAFKLGIGFEIERQANK